MEVSALKTGMHLIEEMAELTGLPKDWVTPQLMKLVENSGLELSSLTLDDLRPVLLQFLSDMVLDDDMLEPLVASP